MNALHIKQYVSVMESGPTTPTSPKINNKDVSLQSDQTPTLNLTRII